MTEEEKKPLEKEVEQEIVEESSEKEEKPVEEKPVEETEKEKIEKKPSFAKATAGKEEKVEEKPEEKVVENKEVPSEKKKEEPVKIPKKFKDLVKEIEEMSVLDLSELIKILEKKFNVSSVAPIAAAAPASASTEASADKEEKSSFNIELTGTGDKKIEVIKAIRDITQKGLKDSKDLVDAVASGSQMIRENVKKEEAEEIKSKLEAAGAKVELK